MTFTSLAFFIFVCITIALYYALPLGKYQWVVLLFASYFFYVYNSRQYTAFILFTSIMIYGAALIMEKLKKDASAVLQDKKEEWDREEKKAFKSKVKGKNKAILAITLVANFGILFSIKYLNSLVSGLQHLITGQTSETTFISLLLPLGISFYTFQATGYLIDVYRGTVKAEKNFFKFALFVSFFPQIIQGPISSFETLENQLFSRHTPEWKRFKNGGELILWGLFKKLVIADRLYHAINTVAEDYGTYQGQIVLFAVLMYSLQLYADFSGGIDVARGVAKILGIDLENNFRQPYFSKSINEYWRRWHITLGAWMKKYVFYPLAISNSFTNLSKKIGKSAWGKTSAGRHLSKSLPAALASFIVFLLIGIWHGANSRYIGFGLWNGFVIMLSTLAIPVYEYILSKLHINTEKYWWKAFQIVRTFIIVLIGYYFDIAPDIKGALLMMLKSINDLHMLSLKQINDIGLSTSDSAVVIMGLLVMLYFSVRLEKTGLDEPGRLLDRRPAVIQWIALVIGAAAVIMFGVYGSGSEGTEFIYMGF